jgi:hypothetical protein
MAAMDIPLDFIRGPQPPRLSRACHHPFIYLILTWMSLD